MEETDNPTPFRQTEIDPIGKEKSIMNNKMVTLGYYWL
jgi:hypothetical protein